MDRIRRILEEVAEEHPYRVPGRYETYDKYNEGWTDAIDKIESMLASVQPEVVRCGECVNFAERDFCKVAGHNVHRKSNYMQVFGAKRRTDG